MLELEREDFRKRQELEAKYVSAMTGAGLKDPSAITLLLRHGAGIHMVVPPLLPGGAPGLLSTGLQEK